MIENCNDEITSDETVAKHKKKRQNFSNRENKGQIEKHQILHKNKPKSFETNEQYDTGLFQEPIRERNKSSGKKKNLLTRSRFSSSSNDEESSQNRSKPVKTYRKFSEIKNKPIIDKAKINQKDSIEDDSLNDSDITYQTSDSCREKLNHVHEVQIEEVRRLRQLVEDTINRKEQNKLIKDKEVKVLW